MQRNLKRSGWFVFAIILMSLIACAEKSDAEAEKTTDTSGIALEVYKSPTCGCCGNWVDHIEAKGITASVHETDDLNAVKNRYGIAPSYQSCHTAVSKGGYVFEGHVPARFIKQFLKHPPAGAIGLSVPGMPVGSPGMEVDNRFMPYQVLLLKKDGGTELFAQVDNPDQQ